MALQPFIWNNNRAMTPQQVARERERAAALSALGNDFSPVGHWTQGAARVVNALAGNLREGRARQAEDAGVAGARERVSGILSGASPVASALAGETVAPATMPSGDMAAAIRSGLIERGLPEHIADGFVMNFQDESGLNPGINEENPIVPGSRGGFGLAQWTGPRRVALEQFAAQRGVAPSDLNAQLDFLVSELQGPEAAAAQSIFGAQNAGEAGAAIVNNFLRPSEEHRNRRAQAYLGGGQISPVVQAMASGPSSQDLMGLMGDPWVMQEYGPVLQALAGQAGQREQAIFAQQLAQADPMYQAQLAQLTRPEPVDPWSGVQVIDGVPYRMGPDGQAVPVGGVQAPAATPQSGIAKLQADLAAGLITPEQYSIGEQNIVRGSGTTVNVGAGENEFDKRMGAADATTAETVYNAGIAAQRNLGRIDQLESLLSNAPTGATGALVQAAGSLGLPVQGASDVQAAQALINSLVPEQRQPGSGPMSDADLELFKQSLPRIINQQGGNQQIINTMRAIAQYDAQGAQIVQRLRSGDLDRATAFQMLQDRPNPLEGVRGEAQPQGQQAATPQRRRFNPQTGAFE